MNIRRIAALVWGLIVIAISPTLVTMFDVSAISLQERSANAAPSLTNVRLTPQQEEIVKQLQTARVIYLGETHDRESDRVQQLTIMHKLLRANPRLAIGMEMFQRPMQPLLDRYLAGKITAEQLRVQSEFDKRWGYKWESYAPILEFAKTNQLPVIALNVPTEITRKAARQGLESLTPAELQYIAPPTEIDRSNDKYRQMILGSYQQHAGMVSISSKSFDRFYTAQLLWDETMADRLANFAKQHPDRQTIAIAGESHIAYGYGIPDRVKRRFGNNSNFVHKSVLFADTGYPQPPQPADFIWNR